jgi:hypothetical protein
LHLKTITATATAAPILAIDLGKYKSVACVYRAADQQEFRTFTTSHAELTRLLEQLRPAVAPRSRSAGRLGP